MTTDTPQRRRDFMDGYEAGRLAHSGDLTDTNKLLLEALVALAKVQYDGTVEGLREQIRTEDWGDVLAPGEYKAAYELTLAAIAKAEGR